MGITTGEALTLDLVARGEETDVRQDNPPPVPVVKLHHDTPLLAVVRRPAPAHVAWVEAAGALAPVGTHPGPFGQQGLRLRTQIQNLKVDNELRFITDHTRAHAHTHTHTHKTTHAPIHTQTQNTHTHPQCVWPVTMPRLQAALISCQCASQS